MLAQLGEHIFEGLKAPETLSESYAMRYGRIPLINEKDVIQATGEELAELSLAIRFEISFCDPKTEIDALKQSMTDREVLPLIMGDGTIKGTFVITEVEVSTRIFAPDGYLEDATVNISLLECKSDEEIVPKGEAITDDPIAETLPEPPTEEPVAEPMPDTPAEPVKSPALGITKAIEKGQNAVNKMKKVAAKVKDKADDVKQTVQEVKKIADTVKTAYQEAKDMVEKTTKIIQRAKELPTSLNGAIAYAQNLSQLGDVTDPKILIMKVEQMSESAAKVKSSASHVVSFWATKEGGN